MRRAAIILLVSLATLAAGAHAATVNATLRFDPETQSGTDDEGRLLVYTPKPFEPGASVAHFDPLAFPNLLMEPFANPDVRAGRVDLTLPAMRDFGWQRGSFAERITYLDEAGTGFDHPTLGEARRAALELTVRRWRRLLGSSVTVDIAAWFASLECGETGGVLAAAGTNFVFRNFPGAEVDVWYASALAESLSGQELSSGQGNDRDSADIIMMFNSEIDNGCLPGVSGWYYGTDDTPPDQVPFVTTAMHEMAHGLGFTSFVTPSTGALFLGFPDAYSRLLYDNKARKHWDQMNNRQRRKSAIRFRQVALDGDRTTAAAEDYLDGSDVLVVNSPRNLAGVYEIGSALFGPPLTETGLTGDLALARDDSANPTFACRPLINPAAVAGRIALIDRGECTFTEKVKNAQDAGATAVIIIHNEAGMPPILVGDDPSITIPAVRVGKRDGRRLKKAVAK